MECPLESGKSCDCSDLWNMADMVLYQVLDLGHKRLEASTLSLGMLEMGAANYLVIKMNILRLSCCEEAQSMHK